MIGTIAPGRLPMPLSPTRAGKYPNWMRWLALAWFALWFPTYWRTWGVANFAHLCDVAVILTCIGMWTDSALLISSQAAGALLIDLAWTADAASRIFLRKALFPGNEYLTDPRYPLWIRSLTGFHVVMPVLLIWGVYLLGYDRRGWALQSAIALPVLIVARFTNPRTNINFVFSDPFFHRAWGPAPTHISVVWLFMMVIVYLPTHLVLRGLFDPPERPGG
jgi:hypothetical protein